MIGNNGYSCIADVRPLEGLSSVPQMCTLRRRPSPCVYGRCWGHCGRRGSHGLRCRRTLTVTDVVASFRDSSAGTPMKPETAMPERQSRRLVAILAADVAGYSALMGADEVRTVRDLKRCQAVVLPMISEFGGRIIDTAGDGILAEFPSVMNALECAVAIQKIMAEHNPCPPRSSR